MCAVLLCAFDHTRVQKLDFTPQEDGVDSDAYHGLVMGANENTYIMRGRHFDVLRNVSGGCRLKCFTA